MARRGRRRVGWAGEAGWMVAVWLVGAAVFFRVQWTSGFEKLQGNDGDTRLIADLCEHWFRVLHGQGSWLNPNFFYPVKGLLGWSEGLLLYQIFYAPLRLLGCDPFVALQGTVILFSLVGFMTFVVFVRTAFGAARVVAGIGGLVFVFANNLFVHAASSQLSGVYLVPLVLLVGLYSWRAAWTHPARSALLGAVFGLLLALLFFTSYYVTWFSVLAGCIAVGVLFVGAPRRFVAQAAEAIRTTWLPAGIAVVTFGLGLVPFLVAYLPARHKGIGSSYFVAIAYAGRVHDLVNVGTANLFWSGLIHRADPSANLSGYESSYAVTPLVMLMVIAGGAIAAWRLGTRTAVRPTAARAALVLAVTTIVVAVLPLETRFGSPWAVIYHLPGASAMRAIFRFEIVTGLLAALTIVAAASEVWAWLGTRPRAAPLRLAAVALLLLGVAEQINTAPVSQIRDAAQTTLLHSVTPAPVGCRSFYVGDSAHRNLPFFEYQVDAMLIAQKVSLPTLNGYTGYNPPGWNLESIGASDYQQNVADWASSRGVAAGLCELDLAGMTWKQNPLAQSVSDGG